MNDISDTMDWFIIFVAAADRYSTTAPSRCAQIAFIFSSGSRSSCRQMRNNIGTDRQSVVQAYLTVTSCSSIDSQHSGVGCRDISYFIFQYAES